MELANILRFPEYMNRAEYTKAAGIAENTARNRIKARIVSYLEIDQVCVINTEKSPLNKRFDSGSPEVAHPVLEGVSLGALRDLRSVRTYARSKKRRADTFLTAILSGKIRGVVLGSEVFAYKSELDQL